MKRNCWNETAEKVLQIKPGLPNFDGESPNSNGEHLWGVSHRKN